MSLSREEQRRKARHYAFRRTMTRGGLGFYVPTDVALAGLARQWVRYRGSRTLVTWTVLGNGKPKLTHALVRFEDVTIRESS